MNWLPSIRNISELVALETSIGNTLSGQNSHCSSERPSAGESQFLFSTVRWIQGYCLVLRWGETLVYEDPQRGERREGEGKELLPER